MDIRADTIIREVSEVRQHLDDQATFEEIIEPVTRLTAPTASVGWRTLDLDNAEQNRAYAHECEEGESFANVITLLQGFRTMICGMVHEQEEPPYKALDCPYRSTNLACGHLKYYTNGRVKRDLQRAVWLLYRLASLSKNDATFLVDLLDALSEELQDLDVGAQAGYELEKARRYHGKIADAFIHDELKKINVAWSHSPDYLPSDHVVMQVIQDEQRRISERMEAIRDFVVMKLEALQKEEEMDQKELEHRYQRVFGSWMTRKIRKFREVLNEYLPFQV